MCNQPIDEKAQRGLDEAIAAVRSAQAKQIHGTVEVHLQHGVVVYIRTSQVTRVAGASKEPR